MTPRTQQGLTDGLLGAIRVDLDAADFMEQRVREQVLGRLTSPFEVRDASVGREGEARHPRLDQGIPHRLSRLGLGFKLAPFHTHARMVDEPGDVVLTIARTNPVRDRCNMPNPGRAKFV